MNAIREGNDFTLNWTIMLTADTPLDTEGIFDEQLFLICYGRRVEIQDFKGQTTRSELR